MSNRASILIRTCNFTPASPAESIKFPNGATAEVDFYAGIRPTFGPLALDFGFWYYYYPGGNCFNTGTPAGAFGADCAANGFLANGNAIKKDLSFWELYAKATYTAGDWAFGPTFYYTPSFLNSGAPGEYLSLIVKYTAPANMAIAKEIGWYVSGEFGRQWLGTSDLFTAYSIPRVVPHRLCRLQHLEHRYRVHLEGS